MPWRTTWPRKRWERESGQRGFGVAPGLLVAFTFFRSAPPRSTHFYTSHIDYLQNAFFALMSRKFPQKIRQYDGSRPPQPVSTPPCQDQGDYVSLFHAFLLVQQPRPSQPSG